MIEYHGTKAPFLGERFAQEGCLKSKMCGKSFDIIQSVQTQVLDLPSPCSANVASRIFAILRNDEEEATKWLN